MRWKDSLACALLALGVALPVSCRAPTQITMVLSTDIACADLRGVSVTVGNLGEVETKTETTSTTSCTDGGELGSLVVVPSGGTGDTVAIKIVAGYKRDPEQCTPPYGAGCIVARRALHFLPRSPFRINVPLRGSCDDLPCAEAQTCVAGRCVSAVILDSHACEGADGCDESVLGGPSVAGDAGADGGDAHVMAIAAGATHTCARLSTGAVRCWGENLSGGLGNGKQGIGTQQARPVDVVALGGAATEITAGDNVSCALVGPGLRCWGRNNAGQLGDGTTSPRALPGDVVMLGGMPLKISASAVGHGCAVLGDGKVRCWGANGAGQLGDDTNVDRSVPGDVVLLGGAATRVTTSSGADDPAVASNGSQRGHTCAILASGGVRCWGANTLCQLGTSCSTQTFLHPVDVDGLSAGVVDVAAGGRHTCAVLASYGVRCWGDSSVGQGGSGSFNTRTAPTDVTPLGIRAFRLAAGDKHTCALSVEGDKVRCWGDNTTRQMGDGDASTPRDKPVDVPLGGGVIVAIAAGSFHTCALLQDGSVRCWGDNHVGQLGDGTTTTPATPVTVIGLR